MEATINTTTVELQSILNGSFTTKNVHKFDQDKSKEFTLKNTTGCNYQTFNGLEYICSQDQQLNQINSKEEQASAGFEAAAVHLLNVATGNISSANNIISISQRSISGLKNDISKLEAKKAGASSDIERQELQNQIDRLNQQISNEKKKLSDANRAKLASEAEADKAQNTINKLNDNKKIKENKKKAVDNSKDNLNNKIKNLSKNEKQTAEQNKKIDDYLKAKEGLNPRQNPDEGKVDCGKQGDRLIIEDGIEKKFEYKTITEHNINENNLKRVIEKAKKQAKNVVVDTRGTNVSESMAKSAVNREFSKGTYDSIRVIGDKYYIKDKK